MLEGRCSVWNKSVLPDDRVGRHVGGRDCSHPYHSLDWRSRTFVEMRTKTNSNSVGVEQNSNKDEAPTGTGNPAHWTFPGQAFCAITKVKSLFMAPTFNK